MSLIRLTAISIARQLKRTTTIGGTVPSASAPDAFVLSDWSVTAGDGLISVTISSLPANNGASITDLEYRVDAGVWTSAAGTVSFVIPGLTNGTEYDVELRARNSAGAGVAGDLKSATPLGVPDAFTISDWSISEEDTFLTVNIASLPNARGATITDIEYRVDAGTWTSSGGTVGFNITSLTNSVEYDVELRAVNSQGAGAASDLKAATPQTPPAVPSAFVAGDWTLDVGNTLLTVTILSLPNNGGATITDVDYRVDGGTWTSSGGTVSFNITSLTNGTEYDVELRAVNSVGDGAGGDLKSQTPATVPSAFVAGDWSLSAGNAQMTVTISSLPATGGSAITDVEFRIDGGAWGSSGGTTTFSITSLPNDVEYDVELRAVNAQGAGVGGDLKSATPTGTLDPADIVPVSSLWAFLDNGDITNFKVEATGASATTTASAGGAVGTIVFDGDVTRYATAIGTGATLRQDASGFYYLEFNGTSHHYDMPNVPNLFNSGSSVLAAGDFVGNADRRVLFCQSAINNGQWWTNNPIYAPLTNGGSGFAGTNQYALQPFIREDTTGAPLDSPSVGTTWGPGATVIAFNDTNTLATGWEDGVEKTGVAYTHGGALTSDATTLGALRRSSTGNYFEGDLYSLCWVDEAMTDQQMQDMSTALGQRSNQTIPPATPETTSLLVGAYIGNADGAGIDTYETWLGNQLDFTRAHGGKANWTDHASSLDWIGGRLAQRPREIIWSMPMLLSGGTTTLAAAANGDYDSNYLAAAQEIFGVSGAQDRIIVRFGEEMNGGWFEWTILTNGSVDSQKAADFVTAYQRIVNQFRSVSNKFLFEWCPNYGQQNPESCYPGDAYVDIVGVDFYRHGDENFSSKRTVSWGLDWLTSFAATHSKLISIPEWGVDSDTNVAAYMDAAFQWAIDNDLLYFAFWNNNLESRDLTEGTLPAAATAYKAEIQAVLDMRA